MFCLNKLRKTYAFFLIKSNIFLSRNMQDKTQIFFYMFKYILNIINLSIRMKKKEVVKKISMLIFESAIWLVFINYSYHIYPVVRSLLVIVSSAKSHSLFRIIFLAKQ